MKKQLYLLLAIVFIGFVGISLPYTIFGPLFLQPESYNFLPTDTSIQERIFWLGITLALYPLGLFIGSPILGSLSDSYGRKKVITVTIYLASIGCFLTGLSLSIHSLWLLLVTRFLTGITEGNIAIARAMVQDFSKTGAITLHSGLGKVNAVASIAYIIGPILGGIFSTIDMATPFYFIGVITFVSGLVAQKLLEESRRKVVEKKSLFSQFHFLGHIKRIFMMPNLQAVLICSTLFTLSCDFFYQFYPIYLAELQFSPFLIAMLNGVLSLSLALGNGVFPELLQKRFSNRSIILASSFSFSLWLMLLPYTTELSTLFLLMLLTGVSLSLVTVNYTVELSKRADDDIQGEVFGVLMGLRTFGDACICLMGTAFMLALTSSPLLFAALFSLLSVVYFLFKLYPVQIPASSS